MQNGGDYEGLWRRVPCGGRLLVFERLDDGPEAKTDRGIRFCGIFDDASQLASIINLIQIDRLDGALNVRQGGTLKVLYFRRGVYLSARSNDVGDRLGAMLVRTGLLSAAEVDASVSEVGGGQHLGNVLVRRGLLKTSDVYDGLRKQAVEIFKSTLRFRRGAYYLVAPLNMTEVPAMLHMDTQGLLIDSLRKIDEEVERRKAEDDSGLSKLGALPEHELPDRAAELIVDAYNEGFRRLFEAVHQRVRRILRRDMSAFVNDDSKPFRRVFAGVEVADDGSLSRRALLDNLEELGKTEAVRDLQLGLSELLFFVLFAAGDAGEEGSQSQLVQAVGKALETLPRRSQPQQP